MSPFEFYLRLNNTRSNGHLDIRGFTRNKSEGTGYGLFLVKQIIEKGRGQIDVSSLQGEGTTMIITFPMEVEEKVDGK